MKDLLKDVVVYVCELLGCPENIESEILLGIALLFIFFLILSYAWKGILKLIKWRNRRLLNKNLKPYFTKLDVEKYTKYYVTQYYQDISPSNEEEPNPRHISTARQKIVKLFINEVFKERSANKYFIVLAGAGMGKTAFMINLYLKHLNSFKSPFSKQKLAIKLFPLGAKGILEKVKSVPNKKNTILLLDALDEDTEALKDYNRRMATILDVSNEFNIIVITCRTQFFSSEQEEPYQTGKFSFGENGQYYFKKVYLSPFNHIDIKKYINKRFKFHEINKKRNAKKVISKSQSLLVRPMLLSHIEDLIKIKKKRLTTLYIYEVLIDKWLDREAKKSGIDIKFGSTKNYKILLKTFSIQLAKRMYDDKEKKGLSIHYSSNFEIKGFNISELESEFLDNKYNYIKSKSLLNRDSAGNYKFSHKSIFEYFLALNIIENPKSIYKIDFNSFEVTNVFLRDFYKTTKDKPIEFVNYFFFENNIQNTIGVKYYVKIRHNEILFVEYFDESVLQNKLYYRNNIDCVVLYNHKLNFIYSLTLSYNVIGETFIEKISNLLYANNNDLLVKKELLNYIKNSLISQALSGLPVVEYEIIKDRILVKNFYEDIDNTLINYIAVMKGFEKKYPQIKFYY